MVDKYGSFASGLASGVRLGIDLRASIENTRDLLEDRAQRKAAKQIGEESVAKMRDIDAPLAAHREKMRVYQNEVAIGRAPRNPQLEGEMQREMKVLQGEQAYNKLDYAMNTMASNQGNKYVAESMKPIAESSIQVFQTLKEESMQSERAMQLEAQRQHETTLQDDMQAGQLERDSAQHGQRMAEIGASTEGQLAVTREQNKGRMAAIEAEGAQGGKGGKDAFSPSKFLDDIDQAQQMADESIGKITPEELEKEAASHKMSVEQWKRVKKQVGTYTTLRGAGYSDEQLNWMLQGEEGEDAEASPREQQRESLKARVEQVQKWLDDPKVTEERKNVLQKRLERDTAKLEAWDTDEANKEVDEMIGSPGTRLMQSATKYGVFGAYGAGKEALEDTGSVLEAGKAAAGRLLPSMAIADFLSGDEDGEGTSWAEASDEERQDRLKRARSSFVR